MTHAEEEISKCVKAIIDRLTAELKAKDDEIKYLSEILHFGNQDRTMISIIGKAAENKEQALKGIK